MFRASSCKSESVNGALECAGVISMDRDEVEGTCMGKPSVTDVVVFKLKPLPHVIDFNPEWGELTQGVL